MIELNDMDYGAGRTDKLLAAIQQNREELEREAVVPSDDRFSDPDYSIKKMVFVIHGIRDEGYRTHKIARRVKQIAKCSITATEWATQTSSYGYFPMLPFLFPWYRREKVEWLMDQYTEALARYPNASIYVGHSNGTYIMAKALELYPCCFFENVVFAGSVVSRYYDWQRFMKPEPRCLNAILNFVATRDWVVAFFPKLFQFFGRDLGSLGHDGFYVKLIGPNMYQAKYIEGGHGAAIVEPMWDMIADFRDQEPDRACRHRPCK